MPHRRTTDISPLAATRDTPCTCGHLGYAHRIDFAEQARKECQMPNCFCQAFVPTETS